MFRRQKVIDEFRRYAPWLLVTLGFGMLTYVALVRWTPIGWMLNGRKRRQVENADSEGIRSTS